jgi:hypothetical protein
LQRAPNHAAPKSEIPIGGRLISNYGKARGDVSNERTSNDMGRSGGSFPAYNRDPIPNTPLSRWASRFAFAHAVPKRRVLEFARQPQ